MTQNALVKEPIYQQLNQLLRDLIASGTYPEGARFLSERQVCDRYEVSRATANKALSNLVAEGILSFRKGIGTFVQHPPLDYDLRALVSFTDKARASGKRPETRVLRFETVSAGGIPGDIAQALALTEVDNVHVLQRLRLADGVPVIYEHRHITAALCPGLTRAQVEGSIYDAWTRECGLSIDGADQAIRAHTLTSDEAALLGVAPGSAGLLTTSVGTVSSGTPLWYERTLYRGDVYEFRNRLGGIASGQPATGQFRTPPPTHQPKGDTHG